jgi:hypothetical protein
MKPSPEQLDALRRFVLCPDPSDERAALFVTTRIDDVAWPEGHDLPPGVIAATVFWTPDPGDEDAARAGRYSRTQLLGSDGVSIHQGPARLVDAPW